MHITQAFESRLAAHKLVLFDLELGSVHVGLHVAHVLRKLRFQEFLLLLHFLLIVQQVLEFERMHLVLLRGLLKDAFRSVCLSNFTG